ncbi:hypothetical protein DOK78_002463 [Enterococcus sp. DIV2402]|uniref:Transcobalamin-like C-terminal domain-containing protein n=1 Tax=Candidatus Enterococcus lowellii TaxID=2230877 RepID=A0ABZ2SS28_9ENTE|nr:DUF4430 domain-containing protein [Enterococcus sp. DIV2402]MBO0463418.1 DUF4430 domain-containing protein [Enterococcus sp. DIV2402]
MKKSLVIVAVFVSMLGFVGCTSTPETNDTTTSTSQSKENEISLTISLIKEDEVIDEKEITVAEGSNLMDAVKENFEIKEDNGMITSIEGIEQDTKESYFWTYTINDEMIMTGANETELHEGDKVVFTYSKF